MPSLITATPDIASHSGQPNAHLFLEMSKTAQLLSNQLFQLYESMSAADSKHATGSYQTPHQKNSITDLTPVSSGYSSLCTSTDNLAKTSSRMSLLNDTQNESTNALFGQNAHRRLFNQTVSSSSLSSMSSTSPSLDSSCGSSSVSSSSLILTEDSRKRKKAKTSHTDDEANEQRDDDSALFTFKTPCKSKKPKIPGIKESRKKFKEQLSNYRRYRLRRAYNKRGEIA